MDGASISRQKRKCLTSDSVASSSAPLEQLASAFCATDHSSDINHFQPADYCVHNDESQSSSYQFPTHSSSDQQAISDGTIYQAKDNLLSIVSPHLWRNQYYKFNEKSNDRSYWSQKGTASLLSLNHSKLLAEATGNCKASDICPPVSLCFPHEPEQQSANFARISGTCGRSVSSGARSSNIKTRIKWTADLHQKFVNCVNLLGGAEKATPRAILKLMKSDGLTVLHVKSHLQKYRYAYAKCIADSTQGKPEQRVEDHDDLPMLHLKSGMPAKELLQIQQEVQRHLCQQLEIQQNIQQAIKEQGKQIEMLVEQLKKHK